MTFPHDPADDDGDFRPMPMAGASAAAPSNNAPDGVSYPPGFKPYQKPAPPMYDPAPVYVQPPVPPTYDPAQGYAQPAPAYDPSVVYQQSPVAPVYEAQAYAEPAPPTYDPSVGYQQPPGVPTYAPPVGYPPAPVHEQPPMYPQQAAAQPMPTGYPPLPLDPALRGAYVSPLDRGKSHSRIAAIRPFVALAVVLAIVGVVGQHYVLGKKNHSASRRTIALPKSFQSFHLLGGTAADNLQADGLAGIDSAGGLVSDVFHAAKIGNYARATRGVSQPMAFVVIAASARDAPAVAEYLDRDPDVSLTEMLAGAGVKAPHDYDPGPLGGFLRCGVAGDGATSICIWRETSTFGMVIAIEPFKESSLAAITLGLRNVAEK